METTRTAHLSTKTVQGSRKWILEVGTNGRLDTVRPWFQFSSKIAAKQYAKGMGLTPWNYK